MEQFRIEKMPLRGTGIHGWAVKGQHQKHGRCWPSSSSSTTAAGTCLAVKSFAESWEGQSWESTNNNIEWGVKAEGRLVLLCPGFVGPRAVCAARNPTPLPSLLRATCTLAPKGICALGLKCLNIVLIEAFKADLTISLLF